MENLPPSGGNALLLSNMAFMLRLFGAFPTSRFEEISRALVLFDGGTDSAYENYALLLPEFVPDGEGDLRRLIAAGLRFFAAERRPHIWPIFPGLSSAVASILREYGVLPDDTFCGMVADTAGEAGTKARDSLAGAPDDAYSPIRVDGSGAFGAREWADAAWYGFDSGEPAPDTFCAFVREQMARPEILLCGVLGCEDGQDSSGLRTIAATGMLTTAGGSAGIYYVSTHPRFRRRGLAKRVVRFLLDAAHDRGYGEVCLLATPAGLPLYKRCGFREMDFVEIYVREV